MIHPSSTDLSSDLVMHDRDIKNDRVQDENIINGYLHYDDPDRENTNPASRILLL